MAAPTITAPLPCLTVDNRHCGLKAWFSFPPILKRVKNDSEDIASCWCTGFRFRAGYGPLFTDLTYDAKNISILKLPVCSPWLFEHYYGNIQGCSSASNYVMNCLPNIVGLELCLTMPDMSGVLVDMFPWHKKIIFMNFLFSSLVTYSPFKHVLYGGIGLTIRWLPPVFEIII